jgi:Uma2 family endonuclease
MLDPMLDWDALRPERPRPLRRAEYDRLVAAGVFEDERVELLHGVLVTMSPQGDYHATITAELARVLTLELVRLGILDRFTIRSHSPYAASEYSEPEPDIAVVPRQRIGEPHPQRAHLLVEVAESSLRKDRGIKTGIYADAGVPEYWIVDVEGGVVEVYTDPADGAYRAQTRHARGAIHRPIEVPGVEIAAATILPPP